MSEESRSVANSDAGIPKAKAPPGAGLFASADWTQLVAKVLDYLGQATLCSAAGALLADGRRGQMVLVRSRPVDDLFLDAMQRRLLSSYQLCVGPAAAEPEINTVAYGDSVSGPYEPPRSLLTAPVLCEGRVVGVVAVASVLSEAFSSQDVCTLSAVAAQVSASLKQCAASDAGRGTIDLDEQAVVVQGSQDSLQRPELKSRVRHYVTSICGLARLWQSQDLNEIPEILARDLDAIAENALRIRELLVE